MKPGATCQRPQGAPNSPYRSGQFQAKLSPAWKRLSSRRNPTVQIRAVPSQTDRSEGTHVSSMSQSHRTDHGSSKDLSAQLGRKAEVLAAIPPYKSGQFQDTGCHVARRGAIPVAIPPYRSGQFQGHGRLPRVVQGTPSSHPTEQIRAVPSLPGLPRRMAHGQAANPPY